MLRWLKKQRAESVNQDIGYEFTPHLPIDLSAPEFVANPYPTYVWLRANAPIAEISGGGYLLTRHVDIYAAFTHESLGNAPSRFSTLSTRNAQKYVAADLASHIPPFLDGAEHKPIRQMVSRSFFNVFNSVKFDLEALAEQYIAEISDGDDLIKAASQPFSVVAMCRFCGLQAAPERMKELTQAFFHLFAPLRDPEVFEQVNASLAEFRKVLADVLRAGPPRGSFLADLKAFQTEHGGITDAQIVDNCLLVFADGVENIEAGAASLMRVFEDADIWSALENGDASLEHAVREGLRLETPAQLVPRVARETFELDGVEIKKDMPVFLALASGNRDPNAFETPDDFDISRDMSQVVTFGRGRHRCIGEPLAVAQLVAMMGAIVSARLRPQGGKIEYQVRAGHRWPKNMIVKKL